MPINSYNTIVFRCRIVQVCWTRQNWFICKILADPKFWGVMERFSKVDVFLMAVTCKFMENSNESVYLKCISFKFIQKIRKFFVGQLSTYFSFLTFNKWIYLYMDCCIASVRKAKSASLPSAKAAVPSKK